MARTKEQNDRYHHLTRLGDRLKGNPEGEDIHLELLRVLVPLYADHARAQLPTPPAEAVAVTVDPVGGTTTPAPPAAA